MVGYNRFLEISSNKSSYVWFRKHCKRKQWAVSTLYVALACNSNVSQFACQAMPRMHLRSSCLMNLQCLATNQTSVDTVSLCFEDNQLYVAFWIQLCLGPWWYAGHFLCKIRWLCSEGPGRSVANHLAVMPLKKTLQPNVKWCLYEYFRKCKMWLHPAEQCFVCKNLFVQYAPYCSWSLWSMGAEHV